MSDTPAYYDFEVTAKHIAEGERQECGTCPVALALAEVFPNAYVYAYRRVGIVVMPDVQTVIRLDFSNRTADFIGLYDDLGATAVAPFKDRVTVRLREAA